MIAYSGLHFQKPINDWPRAAAILPAGTWIKAIDNVQMLDEAKRVNPGIKTVLRHFDGGWQEFEFADHIERRAHTRAFLLSFVDGTFMNYAHNVDAIEELNEYNASSHSTIDVKKRVDWVRAVSEEWDILKRSDSRLSHIRLVVGNVAIGNDLPLEAASLVQQYGNIAGYHPYVPTKQGEVRPDEWRWYSGRWTEMDARFRAAGITVDWLFTEAGPIGYTGDHLGPEDGWRHSDVCNGNVDQLLSVCKYWMDKTALWNYEHGGRALGQVLYNSGGADNEWKLFEIAQPVMDRVAQFNRDYVPPPKPITEPPPPPDNIPLPASVIDVVDELPMNPESKDWPYATRPLSAIENIVIHHAGPPTTGDTTIESVARYHAFSNGWPGAGYAFYVSGDGTIYKANYLTTVSFHSFGYNTKGLGVCLAGDFTNTPPTTAQIDATRYLLGWLQDVLPDRGVVKHLDVSQTDCPGDSVDDWWDLLTEEPVEERRYHRTTHVAPQDATLEEWVELAKLAYPNRQSLMFSLDDAYAKPPEITGRTPIIWDVDRVVEGGYQELRKWVNTHYEPWPARTQLHSFDELFPPDPPDDPDPDILLAVPYLSQWGPNATRSTGDCGPAAVAMVINYFNDSPVTVDQAAIAAGQPVGSKFTYIYQLENALDHYGIPNAYDRPLTIDDLRSALDQGRPSIPLIHYGSIPDRMDTGFIGGHFIVVVGYGSNEDGEYFVVNDPNYWGDRIGDGAYRVYSAETIDKAMRETSLDGNMQYQGLIAG